ncbi:MAG: hypothetical protein HXY38_13580 [Chloroflexi bacterium]|nr:hypothetical protein [Chloroflexota bacterium]
MIETPDSNKQNLQVSNLANVDVETIHAEMARMHQSSAGSIHSEDVELNLSAAGRVQAANFKANESFVAVAQAGDVTIQNGVAGAVRAESAALNGVSGVVVAGSVEFGNAYAGLVAGGEVHSERIESLILLSPRVQGNVTTVIDTRGAVMAGLVGGLFAGMLLLLGRALFGKK